VLIKIGKGNGKNSLQILRLTLNFVPFTSLLQFWKLLTSWQQIDPD
jgi:hypothetical protein